MHNGGCHNFPSKIFGLTVPEKNSWASLQCFRKFEVPKNFMHTRGYHVFPSKIFGLTVPKNFVGIPTVFEKTFGFKNHSAEKFRGHPFNASENLGYRKILCILGGITFFRRKFLVSQCQKNSWASLQCFRKIGVSKIFMHIRVYHNFPSRIFGLTVPEKNSWASLQCFRKFEVPKNFMHTRGYHVFPSKIFGLTVPKNFVGQPFRVSLISGIEKIYASEGYVTIFCRNFLSHSAEKFRRATLQGVTNFGYRKILCFRGLCHHFLSKFFVSQCRKIS